MNTEGRGLAEIKSRWVGTYNGAGEFGEEDISEEENKGQMGLTSEKSETEPPGLRFVHAVRNGIGGDGGSC